MVTFADKIWYNKGKYCLWYIGQEISTPLFTMGGCSARRDTKGRNKSFMLATSRCVR